MSGLRPHMLTAASHVFRAAQNAGTTAVLFGGGAVRLNGGERETSDLDINATDLKFTKKLSPNLYSVRPGPHASQRRVTYLSGNKMDVKLDIVSERAGFTILTKPWTKVVALEDGTELRFADASLLLLDKIRTAGERGGGRGLDERRASDIVDIAHLIIKIYTDEGTVDEELQAISFASYPSKTKEQVIRAFRFALTSMAYHETLHTCQELFPLIGLQSLADELLKLSIAEAATAVNNHI